MIHVRTMHRRVATRADAGANPQIVGVVYQSDENLSGPHPKTRLLRMAFEAEIGVALDQQFGVDRSVRIVTDDAAFAQRRVLKHVWSGLFPVTLRARLVASRHGQTARRLHDVHAMRVVALDAGYLFLQHRMMLRQIEFCVCLQMTPKTRGRIPAGIDDEFAASAAGLNMQTAGAVARFASTLTGKFRAFKVNSRMRACGESSHVIGVALEAGAITQV